MVIIACFWDNWPDCIALEKLLEQMECGGEPELHSNSVSAVRSCCCHGPRGTTMDWKIYETRKFYKLGHLKVQCLLEFWHFLAGRIFFWVKLPILASDGFSSSSCRILDLPVDPTPLFRRGSGVSGSECYPSLQEQWEEKRMLRGWLISGIQSTQNVLAFILLVSSIAFDAIDQRVVLIHYKLTWNDHILSSWGDSKIHFHLKV